ncbi:MAG TPA: diacylglycerol kinase [Burkholderiaceae bacterium]|nr:diacylglycerol kinase [Burkholderiaceae bacterium]
MRIIPAMQEPIGSGPEPDDSSTLKGRRGIRRLLNATRYSIDGLAAAWRHEDAFRQELALAVILLPVALLVPVPAVERVMLIASVLLVLIVELLNTAIEVAVDRDSVRIDPLGKRAKDYGSAAVMISLLLAATTWLTILGSHYL